MSWSGLPPLNSLKAFAAVAEFGGYSQAGAALNVTHAAVSQQVKALEDRLGVALVYRDGRGLALTGEGEALARDLAQGFAAMRRGVEALTGLDATRPVQVTTSPAFAVMWLMPRIVEFQQAYPEITLLINPTAEIVELRPGGIDLAVRYKEGRDLPEEVDAVMVADMVVVGTPELVAERRIREPADLVDLPWLQELGTNEVPKWLTRHGVSLAKPLTISHMPGNLIMEAVRRGDGLSYTALPFVEKEIRDGRLVQLFCDSGIGIYYIKTRPGVLRPPVKAFVKWLKRQADGPG